MKHLTRRACMGTALAALTVDQAFAAHHKPHSSLAPDSLHAVARSKGMGFGSCIGTGIIPSEQELLPERVRNGPRRPSAFADPKMRALFAAQCGILVPENELKFYTLRPAPNKFDFRRADMLVRFARQHGIAIRGHNLLWNRTSWTPSWVRNYDFGSRPASAAEKMLRDHINKVCKRYGKSIFSYDVINETINQNTGEMEDTVFTKHLGWDVVDICFHAAKEAAPHAELVYNDYPMWGPKGEHRAGILKLLDYMKKKNLPVDALGVQGHIGWAGVGGVGGERDETAWRKFLDDVTGMGFGLMVTEFDINDKAAPSDIAARDKAVADLGKTWLDIMLSYPQLRYVMAWGMVDKYNWLQEWIKRDDGQEQRCTPYDDAFRPKPLREAMATAFAAAPSRPPVKLD